MPLAMAMISSDVLEGEQLLQIQYCRPTPSTVPNGLWVI
jgi:hypothetical protein